MSENPDIALELVDSDTMATLPAGLSEATGRSIHAGLQRRRLVLAPGPALLRRGPGRAQAQARHPVLPQRQAGLVRRRDERRQVRQGGDVRDHGDGVAGGAGAPTGLEVERGGLTFPSPGVQGGEIIHAIMTAINSQQDTDGVVRPVRLVFVAANDVQLRTGSYKEGDNAWAKIRELIEIENGCDIAIDWFTKGSTPRHQTPTPCATASSSATAPTRTTSTTSRRTTTARSSATVRA
jgi:hypothetical protein